MGYAPKRFPKHEAFDLNSNLMFVDKLKMIIEKGVGGTILGSYGPKAQSSKSKPTLPVVIMYLLVTHDVFDFLKG